MSVSNFTDEKLLQNWAPSREAFGHMADDRQITSERVRRLKYVVTPRVSSKIENYLASLKALKYIPNQGHFARGRAASALIRHFPRARGMSGNGENGDGLQCSQMVSLDVSVRFQVRVATQNTYAEIT